MLAIPLQMRTLRNDRIGKLNELERMHLSRAADVSLLSIQLPVKLKQCMGAPHPRGALNTTRDWVSPQVQVLSLHLLLLFRSMDPTFEATTVLQFP